MNDDLGRIEELYNCSFLKQDKGGVGFLRLCTRNKVSMNNLVHVNHTLKGYGYEPYLFEAIDGTLSITYYRKG